MDQKMHHGSEHHIVDGQNDAQPMSENLKTLMYMCIYSYTKTTCQYWFLKPSASNRITLKSTSILNTLLFRPWVCTIHPTHLIHQPTKARNPFGRAIRGHATQHLGLRPSRVRQGRVGQCYLCEGVNRSPGERDVDVCLLPLYKNQSLLSTLEYPAPQKKKKRILRIPISYSLNTENPHWSLEVLWSISGHKSLPKLVEKSCFWSKPTPPKV